MYYCIYFHFRQQSSAMLKTFTSSLTFLFSYIQLDFHKSEFSTPKSNFYKLCFIFYLFYFVKDRLVGAIVFSSLSIAASCTVIIISTMSTVVILVTAGTDYSDSYPNHDLCFALNNRSCKTKSRSSGRCFCHRSNFFLVYSGKTWMALEWTLVALSALELVVSIVLTSLFGAAMCCRKPKNRPQVKTKFAFSVLIIQTTIPESFGYPTQDVYVYPGQQVVYLNPQPRFDEQHSAKSP